jgi:hypothetical protein
VRDNDWKLVAMYVERGRLDEVFRDVTSVPDPGAA